MKPKLLCLCDSPTVYTGFANVVRNLVGRWQPNFEQIDIWGINYSGWPHTFAPIRIFPAGFGDWNTATKLTQFLNLLGSKDAGYTHLWILQDCNQLSGGDVPKYLRQIADARGIKVTFYYPVDSNLESRWLDCVAAADESVTYTRYGYEQTRKVNHKIKPHVIPHGVDTTIYHPLANRMELRHQRFGKWLGNDDFFMVNVNRNERRKAPQHSLEILARLLKLGVKVKLLMHCPRQALNEGTDLELVGKQLGIPHGDHWQHHDKAHANYNGLLTEAGMNELYNCADMVLSTSTGEGWGLCVHPKTPVRTPSGFTDIENIKVGDKVLTCSGFRNVTGIASREYDGDLIEITAHKRPVSFPLRLTPDHQVLTTGGWIKAADVTTEVKLVVARDPFADYDRTHTQRIDLAEQFTSPEFCRSETNIWMEGSRNKGLRRRIIINKEFAELFGIYLAEGSACKKGIVFSISQEECELTATIIDLVKRVWGLGCAVENCPRSKKRWVRVYSVILKEFYARWCGRGARNKHIGIFDKLTKHTAAKVLKGVWMGDGSDGKNGYSITTCSRQLALQLLVLAEKLHIPFTLSHYLKRDSYDLKVGVNSSAYRFAHIVGEGGRFRSDGMRLTKAGGESPVKAVNKIKYTGLVHDIQVDGEHNFMTHQCVVHNSLTEGGAAGCLVASPAHTSCLEITQTFESLGQTSQMHSLPLAPQCSVNMMDNSRVRHPVDVAGAAEVIARLAANPQRFELNAAVKDWLNWDRIAREFLNVMLN